MRNPELNIRAMREEDVRAIYAMLRESAIAHGSEKDLCADPCNLLADGFGTEPRFQCLVAESAGDVVGLILYFFVYSTWIARKILYVEDLYVSRQHRRKAIGRTLMAEVAKIAMDAECRYMRWTVLRTNRPALRFYQSIGAVELSRWTTMCISGQELERLSTEALFRE